MTDGFFTSASSAGPHRIFYQTWGASSGRPLVCVHGLTGSSQDFKYVGDYLQSRGYYVAALDMPGRGRSDFLENSADYNFTQYFRDLRAFLTHLSLTKVDWLGVSMGGLLGIRLAGEDDSVVDRLVLSDVGPEVPQGALDFIGGYLTLAPVFSTIDDVVAAFKQGQGTSFSRGEMTEEQWRHYASTHVRRNAAGLWIRAFDVRIADNFSKAPLGNDDLWAYWDKITRAALVIRGELSVLLTEDIVTRMAARKPGVPLEIVRIPGAGHVPSLYPEKQIRPIEDFLNRRAPAAA